MDQGLNRGSANPRGRGANLLFGKMFTENREGTYVTFTPLDPPLEFECALTVFLLTSCDHNSLGLSY